LYISGSRAAYSGDLKRGEKRMTIILCDDDVRDLKTLKKHIERFGREQHIEISIIEIPNPKTVRQIETITEKQEIDAIFLDIDMPYITGNKVAEELLERNPDQCIIFFTNREEMVYNVIQYKPFRFIKKQHAEEINDALLALVQRSMQEGQVLIEKGKTEIVKVPAKEITYLEASNHKIIYHTVTEELEFRGSMSMSKIEKELAQFGFIRTHVAFVVNIRYIKRIDKKNVWMMDGTCIPMGGKYKEMTMKNYKIMLERICYGQ
jgi:DNA-binding LytR/AlgR family response regulator